MSRLFPSMQDAHLPRRLVDFHLGLLALICVITGIGVLGLYSAGDGSWQPWAFAHIIRFAIGLAAMLVIALIDIRFWFNAAYWVYGFFLLLIVAVEIMGTVGMGAQRWLAIGPVQIQPSEFMKIAVVLVLARYFSQVSAYDIGRFKPLVPPTLLLLVPVVLVLRQPNLGTALMLIMVAGSIYWLSGVRWWKFAAILAAIAAAIPVVWHFMHDYQKNRVMTFLHPESDPLGTGYHITQAKIALGSGGLFGKGFLAGTQSHLNFLPETQTDFIFTLLAEEWGLIGALVIIGLYTWLILYGVLIGFRVRNLFSRLLCIALSVNLALYMFINIGMVMGLLPVVGVPLPLISNGGSSMWAVLFGFGLMMSAYVHRDTRW